MTPQEELHELFKEDNDFLVFFQKKYPKWYKIAMTEYTLHEEGMLDDNI